MSNLENLKDKRFNNWLVIELDSIAIKNRQSKWLCECSCENKTRRVIYATNLKRGVPSDCGCAREETLKQMRENSRSNSPLYTTYHGMKARCYNPKCPDYERWGGLKEKNGTPCPVVICEEWLDPATGFEKFEKWAYSNGWKENLSINRVPRKDSNGKPIYPNSSPYSPETCNWGTDEEQARERSTNCLVNPFDAGWMPLVTAHETYPTEGVTYHLVKKRYNQLGWSIEDALTIPPGESSNPFQKSFYVDPWDKGENLTFPQAFKKYAPPPGVTLGIAKTRYYRKNWLIEKALTEPLQDGEKKVK